MIEEEDEGVDGGVGDLVEKGWKRMEWYPMRILSRKLFLKDAR